MVQRFFKITQGTIAMMTLHQEAIFRVLFLLAAVFFTTIALTTLFDFHPQHIILKVIQRFLFLSVGVSAFICFCIGFGTY